MNNFLINSLFEIMRVLMGTSEIKIKKMGGGASHGLHTLPSIKECRPDIVYEYTGTLSTHDNKG